MAVARQIKEFTDRKVSSHLSYNSFTITTTTTVLFIRVKQIDGTLKNLQFVQDEVF